jgi:hypothetical protein
MHVRGEPGGTVAGWDRYAGALAELARARDDAARQGAGRRTVQRRRHHDLAAARTALDQQRAGLLGLAGSLGVVPPDREPAAGPTSLPASSVPSDGSASAGPEPARAGETEQADPGAAFDRELTELGARITTTHRAAERAGEVAHLPQLLPQWSGTIARPAVVYLGFCLPNVALTVGLSAFEVHDGPGLLPWFVLIFPLLTITVGGWLVGRLCAPRLGEDTLQDLADRYAGRPHRSLAARVKRHRWLGLLIAWGSWLIPGLLLDWLASPGVG